MPRGADRSAGARWRPPRSHLTEGRMRMIAGPSVDAPRTDRRARTLRSDGGGLLSDEAGRIEAERRRHPDRESLAGDGRSVAHVHISEQAESFEARTVFPQIDSPEAWDPGASVELRLGQAIHRHRPRRNDLQGEARRTSAGSRIPDAPFVTASRSATTMSGTGTLPPGYAHPECLYDVVTGRRRMQHRHLQPRSAPVASGRRRTHEKAALKQFVSLPVLRQGAQVALPSMARYACPEPLPP